MDWLRSGYRIKMKLWQNRDPIEVVWFRVPDDTPFYPGISPFRSLNHCQPMDNDGIGEQRPWIDECDCPHQAGPYYLGNPPAQYLGDHVCGSEKVWREGGIFGVDPAFVTGPNGVPSCCGLARIGSGGILFGGSAYPVVLTAPTLYLAGAAPGVITTEPGDPNPGGLAVVCIAGSNAGAPSSLAAPPGWAVLVNESALTGVSILVAWKVIPPGPYTLTWTTPGVFYPAGVLAVYPIGATPFAGTTEHDTLPFITPAGPSVPTAPGYILAFAAIFLGPSPSGWTGLATFQSGGAGALFQVVGIGDYLAIGSQPDQQCDTPPDPGYDVGVQVAIPFAG